MLRNLARTALLAGATSLALMVGTPAEATSKHLTILASVPDLAFPFFVYMMGQIKDEANRLGDITVIESDGERSSPKQSADLEAAITKGVDGIVINPNDFDALAPALQEAIDSKIPAVTIDRRANVRGILAHVSADNVKGGEAQGELVMKLFPNGARVMYLQGQSGASPAIDRSNGLHNVLDKARDKYKFVFEDTAHFDRAQGLSMTESALAGMKSPPDVIVCANDDMALGALVVIFYARAGKPRTATLFVIAVLGAELLDQLLKLLFHRPRTWSMGPSNSAFPQPALLWPFRTSCERAMSGSPQLCRTTPLSLAIPFHWLPRG